MAFFCWGIFFVWEKICNFVDYLRVKARCYFFIAMMRRLILSVFLAAVALAGVAKPIDDAITLYDNGDYAKAIPILQGIVKSDKRNGTAQYYLGMCYWQQGDADKAVAPLLVAEERSYGDASRALALIGLNKYDIDMATSHLDTWDKWLKKNKRDMTRSAQLRTQVVQMRNMLERVEKITIIDSIVVDSEEFFRNYKLSAGAGRLLDTSVLPDAYDGEAIGTVYIPQTGKEIFWAEETADGTRLASASVLDNGDLEDAHFYSADLNGGGDACFPFLMPDGITIYYSSDGEGSIGGSDIFMTMRSSDGSTYQPQNVGMPYNSPYDDYMLVIDEEAGLGWWATDRNQIPGKVTIYVFIPNDTRVNYPADDPGIADHAFVRSIKATQDEPVNAQALLNSPALQGRGAKESSIAFELSMGNGKVYRSLLDFRNAQARQTMLQCLDRQRDLKELEEQLADMRIRYANGDNDLANDIRALEKRVRAAYPIIERLQNQAITQETEKR